MRKTLLHHLAASGPRFSAILLAMAALLLPAAAQSSVTLAWNPNPEPDIAGYLVYVGTSSGNFTAVRDAGKSTTHIVADLTASSTYYFAVQAYNTAGLTSELSTEISYTTSPTKTYEAWAIAASLSGNDAAANSTPRHDGVPNLLKYAFNLDPAGPDARILQRDTGKAGLPLTTLERSTSGALMRIEFLRRKNSDLIYTPKVSTDLRSFAPINGNPTVSALDAEWERVVIHMPCDPARTPRMFATVEVSLR